MCSEIAHTNKDQEKKTILKYIPEIFCVLLVVAVIIRTFFGTEITDEAFYVSDALWMSQGNVPYVLNNYFMGVGYAFLLIPLVKLYTLLVPDYQGIMLYTRLCFLAFHFVVLCLTYRVLRKKHTRQFCTCLTACMIPCFQAGIINFSYNTIPLDLFYLSSALVYQAIEHDKDSSFRLLSAGFVSAFGAVAHPVYLVAVVVLCSMIVFRTKDSRSVQRLFSYIGGGLIGLILIFMPICIYYGAGPVIRGLGSFVVSEFPKEPLSGLSLANRIAILVRASLAPIILLLIADAMVIVLALFIRKLIKRVFSIIDICVAMIPLDVCVLVLYCMISVHGWKGINVIGIVTSVLCIVLLIARFWKKNTLFLYLGIYPVLFSILMIVGSESKSVESRFFATLPTLFVILAIGWEKSGRPIKLMSALAASFVVLCEIYTLYNYPYREEAISGLTETVRQGVYAGLRTTNIRAQDLPELETYLNEVVRDDDYFAFRDNVPCGYLMTHHGIMCDISSWDSLQYSYGRNTPAWLYDYYERRQAIPTVIIYVDYSRDSMLSCMNEEIRYNEFLKAYYYLESEVELNHTFKKVLVYRYRGGFDGNYQAWVNKYNNIPH